MVVCNTICHILNKADVCFSEEKQQLLRHGCIYLFPAFRVDNHSNMIYNINVRPGYWDQAFLQIR